MTIVEAFIQLRDDMKTWVTNNLILKASKDDTGELADLATTDKTSLVAAINELAASADSGGSSLPEYTESDYGKVLSCTADGLVWVEQSGGSGEAVPSAEGVLF